MIRLVIVFATVGLTWGALMIAQQTATVTVNVGEPSPQDFFASRPITVVDTERTQAAKEAAAAAVQPVYSLNPDRTQEVRSGIEQLFATVASNVFLPEPPATTTTITEPQTTTTTAPPETTTTAAGETTTTTAAPASARVLQNSVPSNPAPPVTTATRPLRSNLSWIMTIAPISETH